MHVEAAGRDGSTATVDFTATRGDTLIAWNTAALDAIRTDYTRHSRAARAIAAEFFRAETVLAKLLADLGF